MNKSHHKYNVCIVSPRNEINQIFVFGGETGAGEVSLEAKSSFSIPTSASPLTEIIYTNQRIHADDTITLVKNKILRELNRRFHSREGRVVYEEIYMFAENERRLSWERIYSDIVEEYHGEQPSPEQLRQLADNIPSLLKNAAFDPAVATYEDMIKLPETQVVRSPLGIRFEKEKSDLFWPVNPAAAIPSFPKEQKETTAKNVYMFENELVMDYISASTAQVEGAAPINIYVCLASDFFAAADAGNFGTEKVLKYFTLLYKKNIFNAADFARIAKGVGTGDLAFPSEDDVPIEDSIDIYYDIATVSSAAATDAATDAATEVMPAYVESGMRSFYVKFHPDTKFVLPLESVFKVLRTSPTMPFIKYNPGMRRENLYRLYTEKIARNGKKIPFLGRNDINILSRKIGKSRQIAACLRKSDMREFDIHDKIELYCIFDANGDMSIQSEVFERAISVDAADAIIRELVQPIIDTINDNLSVSGYHIPNFTSLRSSAGADSMMEVVSIDYSWIIPYNTRTRFNDQIHSNRGCFFSLFERIEKLDDVKKGIQIKYKRVGNYQPMEAEKSLITDLFKKSGNVVQVLEELVNTYGKTYQEARMAVARYKDSTNTLVDATGKVKVVENPGFPTNIRLVSGGLSSATKILMVVEMSGITSFQYIDVLQIYMKSFFRMFLYPKTIPAKTYEKLRARCRRLSSAVETAAAAADATEEERVIEKPMMVVAAAAAATAVAPIAIEGEEKIEVEELLAPADDVSSVASDEIDDELFDLLGEGDGDDGDDDEGEIDMDLLEEPAASSSSGGAAASAAVIEDDTEIELQKKLLMDKSLHPNPFSDRRDVLDKVLFRLPADKTNKNFTSYSRACPANVYRQPVILTDEEKRAIDEKYPGSYSHALHYGSDKTNMNWYICPRYWCLLTNTSMTEADIRAGKCGNSTKIIPKGAKKVPKDAFIYELNDFGKEYLDKDGAYIPHYPGLTTAINDLYMKYPCCFKKWDPKLQEAAYRDLGYEEEEEAPAAAAAIPTPSAMEAPAITAEQTEPEEQIKTVAVAPPVKTKKTAAVPKKSAAAAAQIQGTAIGYVIGPEKTPVPEGKWGFLPVVIQQFLQTDNSLCARPENPSSVKQNTPCMMRYGVEKSSFLACAAEIYAYKNNIKRTPTVDEFREILVRSITVDNFMAFHGGELVRAFWSPSRSGSGTSTEPKETNEITTQIFEKNPEIKAAVEGAMENFIEFIRTSNIYDIDYMYLWDVLCSPATLFENGINLAILEIPNADVTGNVEVLCPAATYSTIPLYDPIKETAILIKTGQLYEPVYLYENRKDAVIVKKTFHVQTAPAALKRVLETIAATTNRYCSPVKTLDFVRPVPLPDVARVLAARRPEAKIAKKVVNYYGNVIGVVVAEYPISAGKTETGFLPCAPFQNHRSVLKELPAVLMDADAAEVGWRDYETTLAFLRTVAKETGLPCRPVVKVFDGAMITGVLTETNQFVQIDRPTEDILGADDGLRPLHSTNFIVAEKEFMGNTSPDKERVQTIKYISLESQFYNAFRSLVRAVLNKYENMEFRKEILTIVDARRMGYKEKLRRIEGILRDDLMAGKVEFVDYAPNVLLSLENISSCDVNCADKKYCMTVSDAASGGCAASRMMLPRTHLVHGAENQKIYFGRIADELLRHKRIRTFMFQTRAFLNLSNIKYNITDNEIILLQNNLSSGDYFENLIPEKYIITYSRARAEELPFTFSLEDQKRALHAQGTRTAAATMAEAQPNEATAPSVVAAVAAAAEQDINENIRECIKEITLHVKGNVKSKWVYLLPNKCSEVFFQNTTPACTFAVLIYMMQSLFQRRIGLKTVKDKLVESYRRLFDADFKRTIEKLWAKEGKRDIATLLERDEITIENAIMAETYYMTNIDLWVFVAAVDLPVTVVLFTALKLKDVSEITGSEIDWLVLKQSARSDKLFFIRSPTDFKKGALPSYSLVTPMFALQETRAEFQQEYLGSAAPEGAANKITLQQFLSTAQPLIEKEVKRGRKKVVLL